MKNLLLSIRKYKWIVSGDFFRLWAGALASQTASLLFYFSLIWWSIEILDSPMHSGILIGIGTAISVLASPWSGWLADRFHRGKLMAASDLFVMVAFALLAFFAFSGLSVLWVIYLIRIIISLVSAPINPSFRSLLPEVVKDEHLEKAVAFQGSMVQAIQVLAPVLAGVLTALLSYEWVWLLCAVLVGFSSVWEWFIHDERGAQHGVSLSRNSLSSGFKRLIKNQPLRLLALSSGVDQLVFSGFPIYIAVWSILILEGETLSTGTLQTFWAIGVLSTSVCMTFLAKQMKIKRRVTFFSIVLGVSFLSIAFIPSFWFACVSLLIAGGASGIINIYLESFLQRASDGENRARTLAAFMAMNSALIPLGYALAGMLSEIINPLWLIALLAAPTPITIWGIRKAVTIWEKEQHYYEVQADTNG